MLAWKLPASSGGVAVPDTNAEVPLPSFSMTHPFMSDVVTLMVPAWADITRIPITSALPNRYIFPTFVTAAERETPAALADVRAGLVAASLCRDRAQCL